MNRVNEALAKAAEEITKGLAKDQPIQFTERSRKNNGSAERPDAALILISEFLDQDLQDHAQAVYKIARGWRMREAPDKLKSAAKMWWNVPGGWIEDFGNDEKINAEYHLWLAKTAIFRMIDKRQMAISVCAEGSSFREAAWPHQKNHETCKKYVIEAIDIFVEINRKKTCA